MKLKKLLLALSFLIASSVNSYAGTLDLIDYISGNDVTIANMQTNNTRLENVINGGISGGVNIAPGSLVSVDFSNSVSPITRWDESFTDFTYTGMLAPTSGSLSSTTTAGTSYVDGYRVAIGSTAHTYTASKDTYVYVHSGGYYVYQEVVNGASAPSTPANSLLLFKAVTNGSAVTSVSDLRTTGITFGTSSGIVPINYRKEMYVSQASTTTINVAPGVLEINGTRVLKTAATTLTLTTAGDWAGGASLRAVSTTGYVGVDSSGNIKMHTTAPTHSDYALTVTAGTKRYVSWSSTTYRVIGWFRMNATGSGELDTWGVSNIADGAVKNEVIRISSDAVTGSTTVPGDDTIFQNTEGNEYMALPFVPTNSNNILLIDVEAYFGNSQTAQGIACGLFQDSTADALKVSASNHVTANAVDKFKFSHTMKAGTTSLTTFKVREGANASGTNTFNGSGGTRLYGGTLKSFIRIVEEEAQLQ